MNITKRTFNPLLARQFRYEQPEDAEYKYQGNWGVLGQALADSEWTVENGDAVLSSASFATTGSGITSVIISGTPNESTIVNKVTLADGQIDSRIIKLKITDNDVPYINYDYNFGRY